MCALNGLSSRTVNTGTNYNPRSVYQYIGGFRVGNFSMTAVDIEIYLRVWNENETRLVEFFYDGSVNSSAHSETAGTGAPSAGISGTCFCGKGFRLAVTDDPNTGGDGGTDGETDGGETDGGGTNGIPLPGTSSLLALCLALAGWMHRQPLCSRGGNGDDAQA